MVGICLRRASFSKAGLDRREIDVNQAIRQKIVSDLSLNLYPAMRTGVESRIKGANTPPVFSYRFDKQLGIIQLTGLLVRGRFLWRADSWAWLVN